MKSERIATFCHLFASAGAKLAMAVVCLAFPRQIPACAGDWNPVPIRVSLDGATWSGFDFKTIRCKDSSRAFFVGRTFHKDSLAESWLRDSLTIPSTFSLMDLDNAFPALRRGQCILDDKRFGIFGQAWKCDGYSGEPLLASAEQRILLAKNVEDRGSVAPDSSQRRSPDNHGTMNFRARADFLNPTTVFTVAHGDTLVGRIRRAHLVGGIGAYRCVCGFEGERGPASEASENVFSRVVHDPEHCALFGRTWTGLWYHVDGKTGTFHDLVIPDTAIEWPDPRPGRTGFPLGWGCMTIFVGIVLVGAAMRSLFAFPIGWRTRLAVAVVSLAASWLVPLPKRSGGWQDAPIGPQRHEQRPAMEEDFFLPFNQASRRARDSASNCIDLDREVRISRHGRGSGGRFEMYRNGVLTDSVSLEPVGPSRIVAWEDRRCAGFVQKSKTEFVYFESRTGTVRTAYLRAKAHFFSWPDTTTEVAKWWRDELLLPPGREPDILLLPPPPRIELPILLWNAWIRFIAALLLTTISLHCLSTARFRRRTRASRPNQDSLLT